MKEFDGIRIDSRDWPLLLWESPAQRTSDAASADALAYIEQLWRKTPTATKSFMIIDLSLAQHGAPPSQRKLAADFMGRNVGLQRQATVGGAIVVASTLMRGVITAVFWLRPPPVQSLIVASRTEAYLRGIEALEAYLGTIPPNLRSLRERLTSRSVP